MKFKKSFSQIFIIVLILGCGTLCSLLLKETYKNREYIKDYVSNGAVTETVSGKIKTVKPFRAGKTGNNLKVFVPGDTSANKKWIYFYSVTKKDKNVLKAGNYISVETYPRRPNAGLLVDNEYFKNTVLFSLGYSIEGIEIKTTDAAIAKLLNNNLITIILIVVLLALLTVPLMIIFTGEKKPQ